MNCLYLWLCGYELCLVHYMFLAKLKFLKMHLDSLLTLKIIFQRKYFLIKNFDRLTSTQK